MKKDEAIKLAQKDIQRLSALVRAQQITIDKLEAQRTWVELTDEEIAVLDIRYHRDNWRLIKEAEAKLKEKNNV